MHRLRKLSAMRAARSSPNLLTSGRGWRRSPPARPVRRGCPTWRWGGHKGPRLKDLVAIAELLGPSPHQVGVEMPPPRSSHRQSRSGGPGDRGSRRCCSPPAASSWPWCVAVGALKNRHPLFGLVNHKVDELRGAGEVLMQGLHVRVERDKVEATVAVELRRPPQRRSSGRSLAVAASSGRRSACHGCQRSMRGRST